MGNNFKPTNNSLESQKINNSQYREKNYDYAINMAELVAKIIYFFKKNLDFYQIPLLNLDYFFEIFQ